MWYTWHKSRMVLILALQFLTAIINTILGIFVFSKNPRSAVNQAFGLFALGVAGWNLSIFLTITEFIDTLLWGRLAFAFCSVMAAGFLWFVHVFPAPSKRAPFVRNLALILGLIFFYIPASSLMIKSVTIVNGFITGELVKEFYLSWDAFFVLTLFYAMVRSWIQVWKAKGLVRNQQLAVTMGITLFLVPFLTTNIILPLVAGDFRWNNLGPIFTLFLISLVAHAIIRYRFLEIRWVVKKSFDFIILWFFTFCVLTGFQIFLQKTLTVNSVNVISSFAISVMVVPIAQFVSRITAKMTSRGSYVFEDAVAAISDVVHTSLSLENLTEVLASKLDEYFGFSRIALVAFSANHPETPVRTLLRGFNRDVLRSITPGIRHCEEKNKDIVEASELQWKLENGTDPGGADCDRQILKFMKEWGIEVMIPFFVGDEIVGIALLGQKRDGSVLSQRDLQVLHLMQGTAAPAMANGVRFAEIKRLYSQLENLDKAKSDFIGVVSHQFRTPLTAILWNSELALEHKDLPTEERLSMSEIHQRAVFLNVTLNRIFDMLALENKQMTFEEKVVNFRDVVQDVEKQFDIVREHKELTFKNALEPALVVGDSEKLASVIRTLVENACNFSRNKSEIKLVLQRLEDQKQVMFRITDTGIGITDEDLPHVFDKFFRGNNALKVATDGAGISLYLARRFVEKQHGTIEVSSEVGKGTTFTVFLPIAEI
jgi:signal transduction histidine kinase